MTDLNRPAQTLLEINPLQSASEDFLDRLEGMAWAALIADAAVEFKSPEKVLEYFPLGKTPVNYLPSICAKKFHQKVPK